MRRLGSALTSAIVIVVGLITLLGVLVSPDFAVLGPLLNNDVFSARGLASIFLQLTVITAAVTILIGLLNVFSVHSGRIIRRKGGWFYSLVLVISALAVIILTLLERAGVLTGQPAPTTVLLESVQVSIESALAGLVLFALVYGAYRMMRRRVTLGATLFTVILLILLIAALPLSSPGIGVVAIIRDWLMSVPVSAGSRGILLGIALATVVVGVRVLTGQDRSYRE